MNIIRHKTGLINFENITFVNLRQNDEYSYLDFITNCEAIVRIQWEDPIAAKDVLEYIISKINEDIKIIDISDLY